MAAGKRKKSQVEKRSGKFANFFINFTLDKKTKRRMWIVFGIGLLLIIGMILTIENTEWIFLLFAIPGVLMTFYPIGIILVINENNSAKNLFIILGLVLIGVMFRQFRLPGAGLILTLTLFTLGCGYFFLAFKNFYTVKDNTYLRIVSTLAALFISFMSTGMVFKMQHWAGAGVLLAISLLPSLVFTMLVLITLPGSGYIKWKKEYKKMFTRTLLIPWMFFLLVAASGLLLPDSMGKKFFFGRFYDEIDFRMEPYEIEDAEGLESDQ